MKASELRIWNWVEFAGQSVIIMAVSNHVNKWDVEIGYFIDSIGSQRMLTEIQPIPLTEEWLEKFGFENRMCFDEIGDRWFKENFIIYYSLSSARKEFIHQGSDTQMATVHQLQNLYFALTGEELELKEK